MSRLYLICTLVFFVSSGLFGQSKLHLYLKHADQKSATGDYYYALQLYEKALDIDSNSVEVIWKYAECLRAYKNYPKAADYYAKVVEKENGRIYPMSLVYLGLMQKQSGEYDAALETFKRAKKKFQKDKNSSLYDKTKREYESCIWAKSAIKDTQNVILEPLKSSINTTDSEFAHTVMDGKIVFSSLRADSIGTFEEVYAKQYASRLYSTYNTDQSAAIAEMIPVDSQEDGNLGNGTFSRDGKRFYYSLCTGNSPTYSCKIRVATYDKGTWGKGEYLGEIINEEGANTTMPSIGYWNEKEILFFCSDRKGTLGGLDIWMSEVINGQQYLKPEQVHGINSIENDISPWWDSVAQKLYFSSTWHDNFGGYDIFESKYTSEFNTPVNLGIPFNSSANDLYFFKHNDTSYLSSNRLGALWSKNPTCCSDIFTISEPPKTIVSKQESLAELNERLPVTLYFHNDCPDPKTRDTTTKINYLQGYLDYRQLLEQYKLEYSAGLNEKKATEAKEDIENFFTEYIDQGVKDLARFTELLLLEMEKGAKISITVKGFASPLAKTDYNVLLTKRRVHSFVNYLHDYQKGVFIPYLSNNAPNGGSISIITIPFGEYTANKLTSDNYHDQKNSVYSRAAASERKIEIQSVAYTTEINEAVTVSIEPTFLDLGDISTTDKKNLEIQVKNTSNTSITLEKIEQSTPLLQRITPSTILPNQKIQLLLKPIEAFPTGVFSVEILLYFKELQHPISLTIAGDGQE